MLWSGASMAANKPKSEQRNVLSLKERRRKVEISAV